MFKKISSLPLALALLCAIAGMSVGSTLFDAPEIFATPLFRGVVALFFVNLLLCDARRIPATWRRMKETPEDVARRHSQLSCEVRDKESVLEKLRAERFSIQESDHAILATRKKTGLWAAHILHWGLLLIIIGALLTTFQVQGDMRIGPGERMALPDAIVKKIGPAEMTLLNFETVYDDKSTIANWISTFDLKAFDADYDQRQTAVNAPFKKRGLAIYQMAWETRYLVHLTSETVTGDYAIPEKMPFPFQGGSLHFAPMAEGIDLLMLYDAHGALAEQKAIRPGDTLSLPDGSTLHYEKPIHYTVLHVKYNPWLPVVFLGFFVASLGSMLFWFGRYERVRLVWRADGVCSGDVLCRDVRRKKRLLALLQGEGKCNDQPI